MTIMSTTTLKRTLSVEDLFQDYSQENKRGKASPAEEIASAIISNNLQAIVAPTIEQWLEQSSQAMQEHQVYYDKGNDLIILKIDANHLCIASKQLGTGHNNFIRKAVVIDSQSFEITATDLKLRHSPYGDVKKRPKRLIDTSFAHGLIQQINHENITPPPHYYKVIKDLPTPYRRKIDMQLSLEPLFDDVSHKYRFASASQIQSFAFQLSSGLQYLHEKGILHRNIRSDNIAIHQGRVILMDWDTMTSKDDPNPSRRKFYLKDGNTLVLNSAQSESIQFGYVIQNWLHFYLKPDQGNEYSYIERDEIRGAPDEDLCLHLYDQGQRLIDGEPINAVFPTAAPTDLQA